jgi:DNA-binding MarR family transcriptional regulator
VDILEELHQGWVDRGWLEAADGMSTVFQLAHVHRLVVGRTEAVLRPMGLSFAGYELLMKLSLAGGDPIAVTQLGEMLQVHPTSVSSVLGRLESARLVIRVEAPQDRRKVLIGITRKGRSVAAEATAQLNRVVFERLPLTAVESEQLWLLLRNLRVNAGDFNAGVSRRVS